MSTTTQRKTYMLDDYHEDGKALFASWTDIQPIGFKDPQVGSWSEDAEGLIIRSETKLGEADLAKAKKLKYIVKQGVGIDNVDLVSAKKYGIQVYITPGINSEPVAEMALAMGLCLARRLIEYDTMLRAGQKIVRSKVLGSGCHKKTVGVIGMGNIGRLSAQKWIGATSAKIIAYDPVLPKDAWSDIPHTRAQTVEEVCRAADIITLHVPLLASTRHMIGSKEFNMMKPGAILINTARGGLVDEQALGEALKGKLWGAALDVQEQEPPTLKDHDFLLQSGRILLTPHVGGSTSECQSLMATSAVDSLHRLMIGETEVPGRCC